MTWGFQTTSRDDNNVNVNTEKPEMQNRCTFKFFIYMHLKKALSIHDSIHAANYIQHSKVDFQ
jgi:hypothetical protein